MMILIAPWIPVVAPLVSKLAENVVSGINTRKARLYDHPVNQVKRLNQAGLPKAAGSNLSIGGGVTQTPGFGGETVQGNIESSIRTDTQRIQRDIAKQQLAVLEDETKNKLNPTGQFTGTNQSTGMAQELATAGEAAKQAQIATKWMGIEKAVGVLHTQKQIDNVAQSTKNAVAQHGILLSEGEIKKILAEYQGRMSAGELTNLVRRNTGLSKDNRLKDVVFNVEYQTQLAKIEEAKFRSYMAGQSHDAMVMNNLLLSMETQQAKEWYKIKSRFDDRYSNKLPGIQKIHEFLGTDMIRDMIYLNMFSPKANSNANFGTLLQLSNR